MRWWIPLAAIGGLVVVVIIAGVVVLSTRDVSEYKELLTQKVYEKTGRQLAIDGDFDLSISFSPAIIAEDVTFENADWGSRPQMLTMKRLEAEVALFPMLFGTVTIKRLVLVDADLLAETDSQGRGNWVFKAKDGVSESGSDEDVASRDDEARRDDGDDDDEGSASLPVLDDARIENLRLTFIDGQTGEQRSVFLKQADGVSDGEMLVLEAAGEIDGQPFSVSANVGAGEHDVPVSVKADMAGGTFTVDGKIGDRNDMSGLDLTVTARGASLDDLNAVAGGSVPDLGEYDLSLNVDGGGDAIDIENLKARLGGSDISGRVAMRKNDGRSSITADLRADVLDLDALMKSSIPSDGDDGAGNNGDKSGGEAGDGADADGAAPARLFNDVPIAAGPLRDVDGAIKLLAREVRYRNIVLSDLNLELVMDGGRLVVAPLSAGLGGGTLQGDILLDASRNVLQVQSNLQISEVDIAALGIAPKVSEVIEGPFDLVVDLKGHGKTPHEIASSLDGRIEFLMETGVVHNEYIDLIAADLLNNLVPGGDDSGRTQLNCLVARFDVEDGVATSRALLFDTALTTTAGGGIIDLGKEEADLTIKPRPKDASLLSLAVPISVYGPLTDLGFTLKKEEAILGLAGSLLGSALLGPVGLIVPFVSAGAGDGNACVEAVERPVEPETKAQDGAASPIERITDDEAVEDMVEDLINIFD